MRPKKFENAVNSFSYPMPKSDTLKEFRIIAAREGKSFSELVVELIEEYVKNHAEGNSTFKLDVWQEDPEFKAIPTLLSPQEKWNKYIDDCNDNECTQIALMSNHINQIVRMRRTKEAKQRMKISR